MAGGGGNGGGSHGARAFFASVPRAAEGLEGFAPAAGASSTSSQVASTSMVLRTGGPEARGIPVFEALEYVRRGAGGGASAGFGGSMLTPSSQEASTSIVSRRGNGGGPAGRGAGGFLETIPLSSS